jgi:hypothetical protein
MFFGSGSNRQTRGGFLVHIGDLQLHNIDMKVIIFNSQL